MEQKYLIGTSGWGYDEWRGPFYPKSLKKEDYLTYYSKVFYTNEINTTFYNIPSKWVVKSWVDKTPDNFYFTAKIPQSITHENKLDIELCSRDLENFLIAINPLIRTKKLLGLLIQLPPTFTKDRHFYNLREFIKEWPGNPENDGYHLIVEFRHNSWMDEKIFDYLRKNSLTYCAVVEPLLPPRMDVTNTQFAYIRFHGYGVKPKPWFDYYFKAEEIKQWADSIKKISDKVETIGIYFNNHFSGYAAKNSLMMLKELDQKPRNDPNSLSILDIRKSSGTVSKGQKGLDMFMK